MVTIINHSAYHARAIKMFDVKTGKPGYDFSYPILKAKSDKKRIFRLNFGKGF